MFNLFKREPSVNLTLSIKESDLAVSVATNVSETLESRAQEFLNDVLKEIHNAKSYGHNNVSVFMRGMIVYIKPALLKAGYKVWVADEEDDMGDYVVSWKHLTK